MEELFYILCDEATQATATSQTERPVPFVRGYETVKSTLYELCVSSGW
jgi:hypothetical protein